MTVSTFCSLHMRSITHCLASEISSFATSSIEEVSSLDEDAGSQGGENSVRSGEGFDDILGEHASGDGVAGVSDSEDHFDPTADGSTTGSALAGSNIEPTLLHISTFQVNHLVFILFFGNEVLDFNGRVVE